MCGSPCSSSGCFFLPSVRKQCVHRGNNGTLKVGDLTRVSWKCLACKEVRIAVDMPTPQNSRSWNWKGFFSTSAEPASFLLANKVGFASFYRHKSWSQMGDLPKMTQPVHSGGAMNTISSLIPFTTAVLLYVCLIILF